MKGTAITGFINHIVPQPQRNSDGGSSYDDTEVRELIQANADAIEALETGKVDKVEGKGLSTNDYTTAERTQLANTAPSIHTHPMYQISGLEEYLASLSARVAALEEIVTPVTWETVEEIVLGTAGTSGQNRYSSSSNVLYNLTHFADFSVGERVRIVGIGSAVDEEGEVLAKMGGPNRILVSIDITQLADGSYYLQKAVTSYES